MTDNIDKKYNIDKFTLSEIEFIFEFKKLEAEVKTRIADLYSRFPECKNKYFSKNHFTSILLQESFEYSPKKKNDKEKE